MKFTSIFSLFALIWSQCSSQFFLYKIHSFIKWNYANNKIKLKCILSPLKKQQKPKHIYFGYNDHFLTPVIWLIYYIFSKLLHFVHNVCIYYYYKSFWFYCTGMCINYRSTQIRKMISLLIVRSFLNDSLKHITHTHSGTQRHNTITSLISFRFYYSHKYLTQENKLSQNYLFEKCLISRNGIVKLTMTSPQYHHHKFTSYSQL